MKFQLIDHGINHSQYFPGCGIAFTDYDQCRTGIGNDPREALDDCLDQIAEDAGAAFAQELERRILADFPAFDDSNTTAAATVDRGEKELAALEDRIVALTEEADAATDDEESDALRDELAELEDRYTELEEDQEFSELWYHISIRYCHPENLDGLSIDPEDYDAYAEDEEHPQPLRDYAAGKARAMRHRLAGDIAAAFQEEAHCDRIYNKLEEHLKW